MNSNLEGEDALFVSVETTRATKPCDETEAVFGEGSEDRALGKGLGLSEPQSPPLCHWITLPVFKDGYKHCGK